MGHPGQNPAPAAGAAPAGAAQPAAQPAAPGAAAAVAAAPGAVAPAAQPAAPAPAAPAAAGPDPQSEIDQLRKQLARQQAEQDRAAKINAQLRDDITALDQSRNQLTQASAGYDGDQLNVQKQKLVDYVTTTTPVAEAAVGANKDAIDKVIKDYDDAVLKKQADRDAAQKKAKQDADDAQVAKSKADSAQQEFDRLKNLGTTLTANIRTLQALQSDVDKATSHHPATMYFLLDWLGKQLKDLHVEATDTFDSEISAAWNDLDKAKQDLRTAQATALESKDALAVTTKELTDLQTQRRQQILQQLAPYDG